MPLHRNFQKLLLAVPFLAAITLFAGCTTDPEEAPRLALARIKIPRAQEDTSVTTFTYDRKGMRVKQREGFIVRHWDAKGRYAGMTVEPEPYMADTADWAEWPTPDSTHVRGFFTDYSRRYFKRRPNCFCADSIRHYAPDRPVTIMRYTFDAQDNPVQLTYQEGGSEPYVGTLYENVYENGRLARRIVTENGLAPYTQLYEYEPLDSLLEDR